MFIVDNFIDVLSQTLDVFTKKAPSIEGANCNNLD
jgi:hypothetical protein